MNRPLHHANADAVAIDAPREHDSLTVWLAAIAVILLCAILYVFWSNFSGSLGAVTGMLKELLAFCLGIAIPASVSISAHRACKRLLDERDQA